MSPQPILTVRDLSRSFSSHRALQGATFSVDRGETFALVGPNGAGKSTTIAILTTLLRASGGSATVAGFNVFTEPARVRDSIGVVFQESTLDPYLSALENLSIHAALYGMTKSETAQRLPQVLNLVNLYERRTSLVRTFSPGMRRRLEIARGLMHTPQVLLLDEPTVGLDPQTRRDIWRYLANLRDETGLTILFTTHYMEEAERADRLAIIDAGKVCALDSPQGLIERLSSDHIRFWTDDPQSAISELRDQFGLTASEDTQSQGASGRLVAINVPLPNSAFPTFLRDRSFSVSGVTVFRPTLEDAVLACTDKVGPWEMLTNGDVNHADSPGRMGEFEASIHTDYSPQTISTAAPGICLRMRICRELRGASAVWRRELLRFWRNRLRIFGFLTNPLLLLFIFASGLSSLVESDRLDGVGFATFVFPGVIIMATLFTAMSSTVSVVHDREFGFLKEMLVAPVHRATVALGRCMGGATVASIQGLILLVLGGLVGVRYSLLLIGIVTLEIIVSALVFTSAGLAIASRLRRADSFQSVMQFVTWPMFILSGALFPLSNLPQWVVPLSILNPAAYAVDAIRQTVFLHGVASSISAKESLLLLNGWHISVAGEVAMLIGISVLFLAVAVSGFARRE